MQKLAVFLILGALSGVAPADESAAPQATAPGLQIVFDCGDCKPGEAIATLIEGAYLDAAAKADVPVDGQNKATLTVTSYRARDGFARMFFGPAAGADRISGTVVWNGASVEVSDTAMLAISGIDDVARNVGKEAFQRIAGEKSAKPEETPAR